MARCGVSAMALVLAGCASLRLGPPPNTAGWSRVTSDHFELSTELPEAKAEELVLTLERYRLALEKTLGVQIAAPARLKVIAFAHVVVFEELGFPAGVAGFISLAGDPEVVLAPTSRHQTLPFGEVQGHELAHYFLWNMFPRQPAWFAEGMADYLGAITLSADGKTAVIGGPNLMRLYDHRTLTLEQLWQWKTSNDPDRAAHLYSSAWRWVHYLAQKQPDRFDAFMRNLGRGEEPKQAFDGAFAGIDRATLDDAVLGYLRMDEDIEVLSVAIPEVPANLSVETLSEPEAAWQWYEASHSVDLDRWVMSEAKRRFRDSPEALLLEAFARSWKEPVPAPLRKKLLETLLDDPRTSLELLRRGEKMTDEERDRVTRRAIELSPHSPIALNAEVALLTERGKADEALPLAKALLLAAPWSSAALTTVTAALVQAHQCDDAAIVSARVFSLSGEHLPEAVQKDRAHLHQLVDGCQK